MALVLKKMYEGYVYISNVRINPQNKDIFLSSPLFLVGFLWGYLLLVKKFGPEFMKNRKPFNIRTIIIVYNIIQITFNVYMFSKALRIYMSQSNWICIQCVRSPEKESLAVGRLEIHLLKLMDCVETVFFILKKNYRQVSFLHVYHHSGMVFGTWLTLRYDLGDACVFVVILNCFVHAVMFTYYLLSSLDPEWKKSINFKKALTQIQIIQFMIFILFYGSSMVIPNCSGAPPKIGSLVWVVQNMFMSFLFGEFYVKTYLKQKNK